MLTEKPRIPFLHLFLYGFLPSSLKKLIYRLKGYKLGRHIEIGWGTIICGKNVEIGSHTSLSFMTIIRGNDIKIGEHVKIGALTFIDTPHLEIGDESKVNEQVFIGGLQFPNSELIVGKHCQIQQFVFINPAPSVIIGDETSIGGHSLIFGHTSWHNVFEGYSAEFKPVKIGSHVGLGWRSFILPGSNIGNGAMVGANSVVNRSIPDRCLAVGFPARVVSKQPDFPHKLSHNDRIRILKQIIDEMISYWESFNISCQPIAPNHYVFRAIRKRKLKTVQEIGHLLVSYEAIDDDALIGCPAPAILLSLTTIPNRTREAFNRQNGMWMDIESKERSDRGNIFGEEIVQFLRRYGVRFFRVKSAKNIRPNSNGIQ